MDNKDLLSLGFAGILLFIAGTLVGYLPKIMEFLKANRSSQLEVKKESQNLEQQNSQFLLTQLREQYVIVSETAKNAQLEYRKVLTDNAALEVQKIQLMQEKALLEIKLTKCEESKK